MKIVNGLEMADRQAWRDWLAGNHQVESEAWLIFYKAHTGRPNIPYDDAVEEALCFGWVDSIIQRIDDDHYARKFTPRKNITNWSPSNIKRIQKLVRAGRMTEAGLAVIPDLESMLAAQPAPRVRPQAFPPELEQELQKHTQAWENFCRMAPSAQRLYIGWITSAKKTETQFRRLAEAIQRLEQNLPLGMK